MSNIQEHGYYNYRDLQLANNEKYLPTLDMSGWGQLSKLSGKLLGEAFKGTYSEPIGLKLANAGYGNSVYDKNAVSDWDLNDLNEVRAVNQSGLLQLGNGILKMGTTGITTFLDGTVGLLYGLGTGAANALGITDKNADGTKKSFILGLWDNDFNKAVSLIQDKMEEIAPNYYSLAEQNNPWYTNILSANFIGDKILKNMGFTIGALGAMWVTGGTGIAEGLGRGALALAKFTLGGAGKALGASRSTLAGINNIARGTGLLAHHLVLTAVGASGEASIEAINAVKEGSKDAYRNLEARRQELINSLDPNSPDYYMNLEAIDSATEQYKQEIDSQFRDAGNSVYLANLAILSVSNALEFAPLIKGGFQRSAKLADFERRLGERTVGLKEWIQGILRGELASIVNTVDKGWGKSLGRAALNSLTEGSEEAAQNLASNSNQLYAKAHLNEKGEDTILGPRINPEATDELVDYTKAFSKALYDNFGSPESKGWEEFFLGALTGGMGFIGVSPHGVKNELGELMYDPITHKKVVSWKPRSISDLFQGGIMLARRELNEKYENNQVIVDAVNRQLSDPEFIKRTQHAIASKALANEMERALDQNDMVAFKNSEIGKLVEDVFFFRDKGMIDEYKAIYEGMTNIDDKTLELLYTATADPEGNTELSQEDIQDIRKEYLGKAERNLEKIKMIQDYYDFVDLEYRDRSPLFKEELAYQYIRLDDTRRRILELERKRKNPGKFKASLLGLRDYLANPVEWDGTTPSRDSYIEEVNNDNGLTESELKDLERLKRQEKVYLHRINKAKENPAWIDLQHNLAYLRSKREKDSKDVESLVNLLKEALSITAIDLIIADADTSVRLEIINRAYLEGDEELKSKLKGLISASTAYTKSRKRLEKIYNKEEAKELNSALITLLERVYISNNMNLDEVKKTLQKIHDELQEDSIASIAEIMPESYGLFEYFIGEENKKEKGIFSDVLEGAIEDVGTGIRNGEIWKTLREVEEKIKNQKQEALKKSLKKQEEKKKSNKSFEEAIKDSKYVKMMPDVETYKKELEAFGVEKLDSIVKYVLEAPDVNEEVSTNKVLRCALSVVVRENHLKRIEELNKGTIGKDPAVKNLLLKLKEVYEKNPSANTKTPAINSFNEILKQIKDADKNGDSSTVLSLIKKVSDNAASYMQEGATTKDLDYIASLEKKYKNKKSPSAKADTEHLDGEVSLEVTEKDGVKTTKFTWWKKNKQGNIVPTIGGGLQIGIEDIDENSIDTEDMEKVVLTELREKDGKFAGTIRYSIKGQKGRISRDVKFKKDPVKGAEEEANKEGQENTSLNEWEVDPNVKITRAIANKEFGEAYTEGATDEMVNNIELPNLKAAAKYLNGKITARDFLVSIGFSTGARSWLDNQNTTEKDIKERADLKAEVRKKYLKHLETTPKETINTETPEEELLILADDVYTLNLLNEFYAINHIDTESLSIKELQEILSNLEKAISLVKDNKEVPIELLTYANIVLRNSLSNSSAISETELKISFPEASATNDNELNGAFRGLYEVGNTSKGISNLLQLMQALKASTSSLEANYGTVQHAELVQWCIDNILKDLKTANVPVKVMAVVGETYANGNPNITLYTVVEANENINDKGTIKVKDIAKNRWIQEATDGKEYIVIGTLGYNNSNSELENLWNSIREDISSLIQKAGITEGYYVSTNTNHTLKINNIGEGRPAKTHYLHTSTLSIVELVTGSDKGRNPLNLTLKDLKWQIIYTDEPKGVHVNASKDRIRGNAEMVPGKVYVLIPTPNGSYYRHPVNPITVTEINKESSLYKKIDALIPAIIKKKEVKDIITLKGLLVLEKESEDLSYLDIYFNDDGIRVQYIPREGSKTSVNLSDSEDEAIEQLKDIIYNQINPFISVTLGHLSSPNSIKMLDEAGALQLKGELAMLSYVGANYTVIPYNTSTNSNNPEARVRSTLETLELELRYNGLQIFKRGNEYYRNNKLITDSSEIEILNDISAINEGLYVGESLWEWRSKGKGKNKDWYQKPLEGLYYFVLKGNYLQIYHKDTRGNITLVPLSKTNSLVSTRNKVLKFNIEQAIKSAIEKGSPEVEAGEDIDIGMEEDTLEEKEATPDTVSFLTDDDKKIFTKVSEWLDANPKATSIAVLKTFNIGYNRTLRIIKEYNRLKGINVSLIPVSAATPKIDTSIEARKLDAIKRATYDLALEGFKIGDTISLDDGKNKSTILAIVWDDTSTLNPVYGKDTYSYTDIPGTVVIKADEEESDFIVTMFPKVITTLYQKVNKQSQKSLKELDNTENNSTFVERLLNSKENTSLIEDTLYDKASSIAEDRGINFDEDCSIEELIKWFKDTIDFDLNSIPSNADVSTILEIIKNCK